MERISLLNTGVVSFAEGDVYDKLNQSGQTYPKIVLTLNNLTDAEEGRKTVDCTLFYIDRLTDNEDNKLSIQSVGVTVLDQIKTRLEQEYIDWDYTADQFTPFTEKFADLCAGVFTSTTIEMSMGDVCEEEGEYKEKILQIYHPGTYDVTAYTKAEVLYKERKNEETKEVYFDLTPSTPFVSEVIKPDDDRNVLSQVTVSANAEKVDIDETITANGDYDFSKDVFIDKAKVTVEVPPTPTQIKDSYIYYNGQEDHITPDDGYNLSEVIVHTGIPEENPVVDIVENGQTVITNNDWNALIKTATINVNVPIKEEETKSITLTKNRTTTTVAPTEGKTLSQVDVTVDIPRERPSVTITENGSTTIAPQADNAMLTAVDLTVDVPSDKVPTQEKSVSYSTNGTREVTPDEGYNLSKVNVEVNIPLQIKKEVTGSTNVWTYAVRPDDGYAAIREVEFTVDIPRERPRVTITENGETTIRPEGEGAILTAVDLDVNVPNVPTPTQSREVDITENGTTVVEPSLEGYDLSRVTINVNVPQKEEETKSVTITENGTTTVTPNEGKVLSQVDVTVDVPNVPTPTQEKEVSIDTNGTTVVTPDEGYDLSKVTVNVNVPEKTLEDRWYSVSLPTESGETSITEEILPDTADGMAKVNLSVSVDAQRFEETYTENGDYSIDPTSPYLFTNGTIHVNVSQKEEETKSVTITENGTTTVTPTEGKTLSQVDVTVDVPATGRLVVPNRGYKFGGIGATDIGSSVVAYTYAFPDIFDFSQVEDFSLMFANSAGLTSIPNIDMTKATNIDKMFWSDRSLTSVNLLLGNSCTSAQQTFNYCTSLTSVDISGSTIQDWRNCFYGCQQLETVHINMSSATMFSNMFYAPKKPYTFAITDLSIGAFGSVFDNFSYTLDLRCLNALTTESVTNISNDVAIVYDNSGTYTIIFNTDVFNAISDEVMTNFTGKGWTITSADAS